MNDETKMNAKIEKDISGLEQTVEKAKIRQELSSIIQQWIFDHERRRNPIKNIKCLTLSAKDWFFEYGLENAINHSFFLKTPPSLQFDSVEKYKPIAIKAFLNKPDNASIVGCCTIEDFLKYTPRYNRRGLGEITDVERTEDPIYEFVWADFCGEANVERLKWFVNVIRKNINEGFAAITVSLKSRTHGKKYARLFKEYSKSDDVSQAIRVTINSLLRNVNKDVRCVYDVIYAGGQLGRTTMITLVYSVNLPKTAIKNVIQENRREMESKYYQSRYVTAQNLKKIRGWKVFRNPSPNSTNNLCSAEMEKVDKAAAKYEVGWKQMSRDSKIKITKRLGISLSRFACKIAHYHGKLREKRMGMAA